MAYLEKLKKLIDSDDERKAEFKVSFDELANEEGVIEESTIFDLLEVFCEGNDIPAVSSEKLKSMYSEFADGDGKGDLDFQSVIMKLKVYLKIIHYLESNK